MNILRMFRLARVSYLKPRKVFWIILNVWVHITNMPWPYNSLAQIAKSPL
jgi:hypothetical protein